VTIPAGEPTSAEAVRIWIEEHARDAYGDVRTRSEQHRKEHGRGCTVYPTSSGPLLGVLTAATAAQRVLELGTGLGYSALWLACAGAHIDTVEQDDTHAEMARRNLEREGADVQVYVGRGIEVLAKLEPPYDLVFNDGEPVEFEHDLNQFERLLRHGGLLVSANLFLGRYSADVEGLEHAAVYRERLLAEERWTTTMLEAGLALSVLR
jgi:predicted O-methyltransferase YrrM